MKAPTYRLHGLRLRSDVELCAVVDGRARPDFSVTWGDPATVRDEPPEGAVLAQLSVGGRRAFVHARTASGYSLWFPAICEFRVNCTRRAISVHLAPGTDSAVVPLLLAGNVTAFLLSLAGECVLHASAVQVDGAAVAFAGQSGSGKSTLAALFCAGGARLVSDDVLRLKIDRTGCECFSGTLELRLRSSAATVARQFPDSAQRPTVDDRIAVRPGNSNRRAPGLFPLRAIIIPRLIRASGSLSVRRLSRLEALFGLARCPGTVGWLVEEPVRRQFGLLAHAVRHMPVYEATIPWGRPQSPRLRDALLRRLD